MSLFLTDLERDVIFTYKSRTRDGSLSTRLLGGVWESLALGIPASVAPNVLSLAGLLIQMYAFIFSLQFHGGPDVLQPQNFIILLLCFAFQVLSAVDGIHARNIANTSPLGEVVNIVCEGLGVGFLILTMSNTLYIEADITLFILYTAYLLSVVQAVSSVRCGIFIHHPLLGPAELVALAAVLGFSGKLTTAARSVTAQGAEALNRTLRELKFDEFAAPVSEAVNKLPILSWTYVILLIAAVIYIVHKPLLPEGMKVLATPMPIASPHTRRALSRSGSPSNSYTSFHTLGTDPHMHSHAANGSPSAPIGEPGTSPSAVAKGAKPRAVRVVMRRPGLIVGLLILHMPIITFAFRAHTVVAPAAGPVGGLPAAATATAASTLFTPIPIFADGRFTQTALVALAATAAGLVVLLTELTLCRMAPTRTVHPVAILLLLSSLLHPAVAVAAVLFYFVDVISDISRSLNIPILTPIVNVYVNGVYDMCHLGHMNLFTNALTLGNRLIVGVHSDDDVAAYKRYPIMTLDERAGTVERCKGVSRVVRGAPLITTEQFVRDLQIHRVAVSPEYDNDDDHWYAEPRRMGVVVPLPRTDGISTSDLMRRILRRAGELDPDRKQSAAPDADRAKREKEMRAGTAVASPVASAQVSATTSQSPSPPADSGARQRTRTPTSTTSK